VSKKSSILTVSVLSDVNALFRPTYIYVLAPLVQVIIIQGRIVSAAGTMH